MNVYDSQRMTDVLAPIGYRAVDTPEMADLVILNTCHIREKAAEKVYSDLGRFRAIKEARKAEGKSTVIAVAGCVAQAEGAEILRRASCVDLVLGPQTYHRLPELVARAHRMSDRPGNGVLDIEFPAEPKFDQLPPIRNTGFSAFLTIQEGCDKFCTFCVVPYTRGAEYSRGVADVIDEARHLVASGAREITLLGQNVNAYHGVADADSSGLETGLGGLIRRLAAIDGLRQIRYTTSHPADMDNELIAAHGDVAALVPFLHLPVQSGSDRVLARMNRRHNIAEYRSTIDRLLAARPEMQFSTDFIVGFPGETEKNFQATLDLAREVGFIQAFSFKYSPRPGTPGALMADQVAEDAKTERLAALQAILNANQLAFNNASVGRNLPVLLDRPGRKPGQLAGRSPYMQAVHVMAPAAMKGEIANIQIVEAFANSLSGVLCEAEPPADQLDVLVGSSA